VELIVKVPRAATGSFPDGKSEKVNICQVPERFAVLNPAGAAVGINTTSHPIMDTIAFSVGRVFISISRLLE
jgi:hypothetical protein